MMRSSVQAICPAISSPTTPDEDVLARPERDNSIYRGLDPVLAPLEQAD